MKKRFRRLLRRLAAVFAPYLYKIWAATLRYEEIGREAVDRLDAERKILIICLWHGEIFSMWSIKRQLRLTAVVSQSKDGDLLTGVITRMGYKMVRGSSSKGGAEALRGIIKLMRRDAENPCVTMDGPRGPAKEVKDGVFYMAHLGPGLLVPTRVYCRRAIRLKSWDSHLVPLPFSRVRVVFDTPYALQAEKLDEPALQRERELMQQKMSDLDRYAYQNAR